MKLRKIMYSSNVPTIEVSEMYWQEFSLNIENQYPKIKEIMSVSYLIDNCLIGSILLPRGSCWL